MSLVYYEYMNLLKLTQVGTRKYSNLMLFTEYCNFHQVVKIFDCKIKIDEQF